MCGIAGIISKDEEAHDGTVVRRMLAAIEHRGPDDEGVCVEDGLAVGHRRLSILDTSEQGRQPMHFEQLTIVFNGEIYNYLELRATLMRLGHRFATGTDTEVILHAYAEWGEQCLDRFRGMWAFAIIDRPKNRLFCSRDRFGIKPFYYLADGGRFLFASEIKALLAAGTSPEADRDTLLMYLVVGYSHLGDTTFFRHIRQLEPGHNAMVDLETGRVSMTRYYRLSPDTIQSRNREDYAQVFDESVRLHLRSDVPLGSCLSGGLDSSTLVAVSSRLLGGDSAGNYIAITAQSEAKYNDESEYARQVVDHCSLDWRVVKPTYDDFSDHLESCLRIHDEPVGGPSIFMQYWVMREAKRAGLKVILDGQGGDETLLGYERYYPSYFWHLLRKGAWSRLAREYVLAAKHSNLSLRTLTGYTLYFLFVPLRKWVLSKRAWFVKKQYLTDSLRVLDRVGKTSLDVRRLQFSELTHFQLPKLLQYEDRNSMAHSIEARVPFVDHACVETALALPAEEKIRDGYTKYALRVIADTVLPKSIAWRRNKFGFEAPSKIWLAKHLPIMQAKVENSKLLSQVCDTVPALANLSLDMRWRLYNIAVWEEQHNVV